MADHRHGGPYDRGSADRYYGRNFRPHYFVGATYSSLEIKEQDMTKEQLAEYKLGYDEQDDRKDWG